MGVIEGGNARRVVVALLERDKIIQSYRVSEQLYKFVFRVNLTTLVRRGTSGSSALMTSWGVGEGWCPLHSVRQCWSPTDPDRLRQRTQNVGRSSSSSSGPSRGCSRFSMRILAARSCGSLLRPSDIGQSAPQEGLTMAPAARRAISLLQKVSRIVRYNGIMGCLLSQMLIPFFKDH